MDCPRELHASTTPCSPIPRAVPSPFPRAIALYERDGGIAWKHDDETRRARDLVLGFVSTVGNYDYGFDWIFHQDGALEMRVALTGVMAAKAVADGAHDPYSHLVGPEPGGAAPPAFLHLPPGSWTWMGRSPIA